MGAKYFGAAVRRREDPRFLRGEARYVDDVKLPGLLHAAFLRSPHAHARLGRIRTEAAARMPGVVRVFTFADLERWMKPLPLFGAPPPGLAAAIRFDVRQAPQYPLCRDRARHVGEAVAMVVAGSRAQAEDAVERIEVDWDPLPAVVDMRGAAEPSAPLVHPEWGTNVAVGFTHAIGDPDGAFADAEVVVHDTFHIQRYVGMPIETRGVVAQWDRRDGTLITWNSTQVAHFVQQGLAATLDLPHHKIRVIAPDLGGGFGTKASGYAEDALVPIAAMVLHRPVKWIEDRREHMMAAAHARHQIHDIALAAKRDGTMLGVRDRIWLDLGAYNVWGIVLPYNTVAHLLGPHRIRNMRVDVRGVVTHKTPNAPYRGAGRPETVFAMDRIVDRLARELGLDPADIRRRNYIAPDQLPWDLGMPYRDGNPLVYDSGDFPAALEAALKAAGYDDFRREQPQLRARGVWRGIGISGYVEGTAIGPFEGASVKLDLSGRVTVATGAVSSGQGHETAFAQVCADVLGVPIEHVTVVGGDTAAVPFGVGTFASRSGVTAGSSIADAAREVRDKLVRAAAALLEAAPADVEIEDGRVFVRGAPASAVPLARVIQASIPTFAQPGVATPDFEASAYHHVPTVTYASAVHVAQVEVDIGTGHTRLMKYVVAHDCGKVINPLIVEGQVHGGVAQGVGGALFEEMVYDEQGQLLTGSLMDYLIPTAVELPPIDTVHLECPSPRNPLGAKGLGEGGAISPPAAIANAIEDALQPFGVRITSTPVSPGRLLALIEARRAIGAAEEEG
ncbi:MAG TPA: xanthine dehydrogenase family protein molybdopterin-binding subunit [Methylomirabilota bacterium]|jgi:carbon-monoxide dehydrogenase large subunit|nr:xanthine dehydrogenase family protein molybdopterin-binding subunit [Methylomirabilota bacterium]